MPARNLSIQRPRTCVNGPASSTRSDEGTNPCLAKSSTSYSENHLQGDCLSHLAGTRWGTLNRRGYLTSIHLLLVDSSSEVRRFQKQAGARTDIRTMLLCRPEEASGPNNHGLLTSSQVLTLETCLRLSWYSSSDEWPNASWIILFLPKNILRVFHGG